MVKFEQGKTYYIKKEGLYELHFWCTRNEINSASFMLTKIVSNADIKECPILYSMLHDYYVNLDGKMVEKYVTSEIEDGEIREVIFSDYENYLWIDSSCVL